ncbi:MAG: 2-C-methyl-D-erythritol 2,4-cyclodiphosphate synthase [Dysgonamonadaceae bacterium]|jgi:2-C-methyl-D-erythritol 2,4-cyclodiphosphate synthase|nr:2-C-methyl-D-erythritol 2,4-cyclodiphosphate synthase [Dysgonamonadaceae bacterium]
METFRVGFGYDVHAFANDRSLWLGGIQVPYEKGLKGHSDADVVIHAICDALLGAANLRDIGYHFPDTSGDFENIDSKVLLRRTMGLIRAGNYRPGNIDVTICAEKPKLHSFIPQMKTCLAEVMNIGEGDLSLKATTSERMGFVGREEGIAVFAVALLFKPNE